jgi:hypothetical protein
MVLKSHALEAFTINNTFLWIVTPVLPVVLISLLTKAIHFSLCVNQARGDSHFLVFDEHLAKPKVKSVD